METLKEYAPLIAISISLLALLIAVYNATIAKRSYKVNRQQFQNKLSRRGWCFSPPTTQKITASHPFAPPITKAKTYC